MKDEIKKDKDFIHRVEERIYQDDWEKAFPEPEWIEWMTSLASRYIQKFEIALKRIAELEKLVSEYDLTVEDFQEYGRTQNAKEVSP
ncbi:hypothetical protein [Jeotgalibaca arthritidis]|uniref:hypothetical protein n=1 Tax=Jeotgalibaca arthritidis TaxID=1868794 RepID=UPI0035A13713